MAMDVEQKFLIPNPASKSRIKYLGQTTVCSKNADLFFPICTKQIWNKALS